MQCYTWFMFCMSSPRPYKLGTSGFGGEGGLIIIIFLLLNKNTNSRAQEKVPTVLGCLHYSSVLALEVIH